ncbi:MAG: helix-hairpin-helix domain-containing protein [Chloroflexi bacterium]|nr:helix-hairpin-helix domain-containing protein [Chloroflexota bacterium]
MLKNMKRIAAVFGLIGAAVAIARWLAERKTDSNAEALASSATQYAPPAIPVPPDTITVSSHIVLPPEAFEDVDDTLPLTDDDTIAHETLEVDPGDDLTVIKGIGPKMAEALAGVGIASLNDLAQANAEVLKNRLESPRISMKQLEEWIAAAKEQPTSL